MNYTCNLILFCLVFFEAFSQVNTPSASPRSTITQQVGLTKIEIDYSRPSARGRKIIGGLVRFDEIWRTGANKNTTVSFSDDVVVAGKTLTSGKYGLYTLPSSDEWEVFFYKKNNKL